MRWISRHPQLADAVLAAVSAAVIARATASSANWWIVALHLPLVVRRRWPVAVFWAVTGLAFVAVATGTTGPAQLIVPMVAGYTLARHRPRRYLWPVLAPLALFVVGWLTNDGPLWDAVALIGLFSAAVMLGVNRQTHRAYLAELEERARRLERERDQEARLVVAAERARIAREMHDIVAHNLAVMVALTDGAVATTPAEPQRAVAMMEQASTTGRAALAEIRRLVGLLRTDDDELRPQPGLGDLDNLVEQVRAAGLRVTFDREGSLDGLSPGLGLAVYRIVQEALTNTMRHAGPGVSAAVALRLANEGVEVEVLDDGTTGPPSANGHGLTGMAERAASYGGRLEAGPRPGGGWRVHVHLPTAPLWT